MTRLRPLLLLSFASSCVILLAQDHPAFGCRADARVEPQLAALFDTYQPGSQPAQNAMRWRDAEALRRAHPNDFFVAKAWIRFAREHSFGAINQTLTAEARRTLEANPSDPGLRYLYAASLIGVNTPEAVRAMKQLAAEYPRFPWPHRSLVDVYSSPAFRAPQAAAESLRAFWRMCPDDLSVVWSLSSLPSADRTATASHFRKHLKDRVDADAMQARAAILRWERVLKEPQAQLRLRQDLRRTEALLQQPGLPWVARFHLVGLALEGAALTRQPALTARYRESFDAASNLYRRIATASDQLDSGEIAADTFPSEALDAVAYWRNTAPRNPTVLRARFLRLVRDPQSPPAHTLQAAQRFLESVPPFLTGFFANPELLVAGECNRQGVLLADATGFVDRFLARQNQPEQTPDEGSVRMREARLNRLETALDAWRLKAELHLKQKQSVQARQAMMAESQLLDQFRRDVAALREVVSQPSEGGAENLALAAERTLRRVPAQEARHYQMMARIEESESNRADALSYYGNSWRATYANPSGSVVREKLEKEIRQLWNEMGGTEQGWKALLAQWRPLEPAADLRWVEFGR